MDKKTVFIKTTKGEQDGSNLSSDLKRILSLIDNKSRADELAKRAPPSLRAGWMDFLGELVEGGYIRDKDAPSAGPKIAVPKSSLLKMFSHKPADEPELEELDYNSGYVAPAPSAADLTARRKADEAAHVRDEMEAAVAAAKIRASAEAAAKAEAKARQDAENAARARALADAEAASKAEYRAKKEAESEARAKAAAEAKAKQEAVLRLQEQQEAARAKAKLEEAVRVRAEIEAAARAQQVAEAKARQEMAARMKAEQEAAQARAALEAAAKAKAEEAVRARAEIEAAALAQRLAEESARRQAEAARLQAEQEVARVKAELEAAAKAKIAEEARVRAEIEAAALAQRLAEENARREAEAARLKAEQEALKIKAELEAAKARAEAEQKALAEALARQVAEEKARQEAEAARVRAEQAAALLRAEQEAAARIRAEAEIKAAAEALARQQLAEAAAKREAEDLARRAAELAVSARVGQVSSSPAPAARSFEINLDGFLNESTQNLAPAGQYVRKTGADAEAQAKLEAEQSAPAEVRTEAEISSMHDVAAEMARLKAEAEAARRKLEEETRRLAEEKALAEEQSRAWEEAEQRAKVQALLEIEQAAHQVPKATPKPVVRKHRKPLPLGKIAFTLIVLALIAVLTLPYVYPLQEYVAPLESQLSARLKQPVHIGGISASSLPPRLKLRNVTVGAAQEIKVGNVNLNFDPLSLFSGVKAISNAEIEDVSIQGNTLDKQAAKLKTLGSDAQYPVRHLTLQRVKIVTDEVALPVMSGLADMDAQGAFSRIALHSSDDKLSIDLQPVQGRWQLGVNLKASSLPILPDIVFDDLSAKGDLGDGEVNFTEMDGHIYSGILLGKAKLSWTKGWQLQGSLEAKLFDLDKFFPKYHIEGEMYGEGNFSMVGARLSQMDDTPHLDGSFSVKKGLINVDMVETARLMSRENLVGGRTRYDDLIGLVVLDNHTVHLRQLRITSGALSASGSFDVSPNNQISGNFNAEIKMRDGNNPLTAYGTLTEPKLRAGR